MSEARRRVLGLFALFTGANTAGAALVFLYLNVVLPGTDEDTSFAFFSLVAFVTAISPAATWRVITVLRPIALWLAEERPPSVSERKAVLLAPARLALTGMVFWALAVVVFTVLNAMRATSGLETAREAGGILLGGLTTCVLVLLFVERAMRPLFARVLTHAPHSRAATLGIRPRLFTAWALGSGVPLLAILGAQLRPGDLTTGDLQGAVIFLAVIGLAVGALALGLAARSVADPLGNVRAALRQVQAGDFAARVAVDDGGDIGLLQAGFNQMVEGLQERQQVKDLFGRHVGEEVARQALARGTQLGGEVRDVSALFVDLTASTTLTEQLGPDKVVSLLNAFFHAVVDAVGAEDGWVDKFEGDGALCVFGAPLDQPDHAARALRAARTLRHRLADLQSRHPALDAGIGVASGRAVAGNIGSQARFEYTVIGDPVHHAARLTDAAKTSTGRVLAAACTIEAAGDEATWWRPAGDFDLRGRSAPTHAFEPANSGQ